MEVSIILVLALIGQVPQVILQVNGLGIEMIPRKGLAMVVQVILSHGCLYLGIHDLSGLGRVNQNVVELSQIELGWRDLTSVRCCQVNSGVRRSGVTRTLQTSEALRVKKMPLGEVEEQE